ncbi:MAG: hypothetical protein PHE83_17825 [Opitutaceae bacterium]|nr:hypothetical protein [Opitutaceae bacterium]
MPLIARSPSVSTIEEVSPETAEQWLRKLRLGLRSNTRTVRTLGEIIATNRWQPTHQGPVFDANDELISGMDLLEAISKSARTIKVKVTRNEDPEAVRYYGRGRARSSRDSLRVLARVRNPGPEAALLNAFITYALHGNHQNPLEVQTIHREFGDVVKEVISARVAPAPYWRYAGKAAVALALAGIGYKEKVRAFIAELGDRKESGHRVQVFCREVNTNYHKLSPRDLFQKTLCTLARYCEVDCDPDDPDALRSYFLGLAHLNHLNHAPLTPIA